MSKNRQNRHDRKRQHRKDFSNGRDRTTPPQDQRSAYPKSRDALRADADRRAQIAGIKPFPSIRPGAAFFSRIDPSIDIDLSPGAINTIQSPGLAANDMIRIMRELMDAQMMRQLIVPRHLIGIDFSLEPSRPDLHREMKVGEILAYRCWRLQHGLLRSVYMQDNWMPNEIMIGRGIDDWSERGVHAWKDLNSRQFNDYVRGYLEIKSDSYLAPRTPNPVVIVTGSVLLWGDVVEHEHGYRAEFAKINSIDWLYPNAMLMGRERETLAQLRNLYGVQ